ncbi:ABC transporter ATP-binding protein [Listeria sp. ILCC797]|uniref:ABC transporter ATP-binding protein n=1 Tax=Listeria sp. ILCC797 TaxID=1918333 RepID=UPI000B58C655|nr:ABC transporter ATP-binding protein [Listeria sp. ILCC797]
MTELRIQNLSKRFGAQKAVQNVDLVVPDGACLALIGPNGAGKTTLINMLVQILKPDGGEILLDGKPIRHLKNLIGYLPQYPHFYGWMTAKECLNFMGKLSKMNQADLNVRIPEVLVLVGLEKEGNKRISGFSGGMRQRLGIAQAILHRPKLLVMDEPVSALDPIGRMEVIRLVEKLKSETTILFSTHILADAAEICDHITMIKKGEVVLDKPLETLLKEASTNVFEVELLGENAAWYAEVSEHSNILFSEKKGSVYRFEVQNKAEMSVFLLQSLASANVEVVRFMNVHETLEQIFMKKVSE